MTKMIGQLLSRVATGSRGVFVLALFGALWLTTTALAADKPVKGPDDAAAIASRYTSDSTLFVIRIDGNAIDIDATMDKIVKLHRTTITKRPATYRAPKLTLLWRPSHSGRKMSKFARRSLVYRLATAASGQRQRLRAGTTTRSARPQGLSVKHGPAFIAEPKGYGRVVAECMCHD